MSDAAEDQTGTSPQGAGSTNEQQLGAWQQPAPAAGWSEIEAEADAAVGRAPSAPEGSPSAAEAERQRRPTSLRSPVEGEVPRRRLTPPPFPGTAEPDPRPEAEPAGAETVSVGPAPAHNPGPSPVEKLVALVNERPEVGLGIAFLGGLLLATILRRLAR